MKKPITIYLIIIDLLCCFNLSTLFFFNAIATPVVVKTPPLKSIELTATPVSGKSGAVSCGFDDVDVGAAAGGATTAD